MTRFVFVVIAVLALAMVASSFAILLAGPPWQWLVAVLGVLCAAMLEICWIRVGSVRHRTPVLSLPVLAFPALAAVVPDAVGIGVIVFGVLAIILVRTRHLSTALYSAGLAGIGISLVAGASVGLQALGLEISWATAVSCGGYVLFIAAVEVLRMRLTKNTPDLEGRSLLSPVRMAATFVGAALCGGFIAERSEYGVELLDNGVGATAINTVVVLLALTGVAAAVRLPVTMAIMRRRLNGLIAGTSALSSSNRLTARANNAVGFATVSEAEASARLGRKLCRVAADAIGAELVEVRDAPPRSDEIGVPVVLTMGKRQYVVARRDAMDGAFTLDDRNALVALARTADVVTEGRHNIGGLTLRAQTDSLTMLPNYGAFQEALANINDNRDYAEAIAVMFIDLDNFKRMNDQHGHQVGDELLRSLGARLSRAVRTSDVVARVGGDEFVITLTQLSSLADARLIAEEIIAAACSPLTIGDLEFTPVLSVGLAYSAHRETDLKQLVADADKAMLAIKRNRRSTRQGGTTKSSSLNIANHRSFEVNDIVVRAIEEDLLEVAFQPIVNLVTGRIWAFEALVRYTHPQLGSISPSMLVEKAKALGRMDALTVQVSEKAMAAAAQFKAIDRQIACMTINIDAPQVLAGRVGTYIEDLAERYPEITICLELNEGSLSMVSEPVRAHTEYLRDLGIMIAVDDYGSQDSSVDSLVRIPMDILKIDKSLVDDLDDIRQREVLTALQGFGDKLEYSMIVEGVENQAMADHLSKLGIRNAQGFHYGVPQSLAETLERLHAHGALALVPPEARTLAGTLGE